jgi:DNA polymerase III sliding clamp (beta) subunit (PCNA family)
MKIKRQELVDVLMAIKPGLAQKAIVDQATHFIFTGKRVLTYNDRICISYPFKTDFSCSVSAEEFYKILNKISDDDIIVEFNEGVLKIGGLKVKAALTTGTGETILSFVESLDLDNVPNRAKKLPDDFKEAIKLCLFSASSNMSTPALTCLFIHDDLVASTDDLRISEYKMKRSMGCSVLIPASSVVELIKFEIVKFAVAEGKTWIYFLTKEGAIFCSRLIDVEFPDYAQFLEGINKESIMLPDDMNRLVETASILAEEAGNNQEVEIQIGNGRLKCKGQNKIGWIESESRIQTKRSAKFVIVASFFLDILNHTHTMFFDENKALFNSKEFRHVIALKGE